MRIIERADLFLTEGSHDKEYHLQLIDEFTDSWRVNFQYGKRAQSPQGQGTKIEGVPYNKAKKVFDKKYEEEIAIPDPGIHPCRLSHPWSRIRLKPGVPPVWIT